MNSNIPIISSKKLKSLQPLVYAIIDGANLMPHTSMPRMLTKTDTIELDYLNLKTKQINIEELFHTLLFLQGTSLNLAGLQRVFIRTVDLKLIQVDPRLTIPFVFDDFQQMMHLFSKEGTVRSADGNSTLMKFVKSDIGKMIPPGIPRFALYVDDEAEIVPVSDFAKDKPIAVYVHLNPKNQSVDELMEKAFCVSNDKLNTGNVMNRVIKHFEIQNNVW
ncbi:Suppressor Mra1 superfamily [Tritrichomonas foetus]|uniref:Suppressor Mra1 superfamily n=1 Tax=Tritrichomonas foetus TaxID=1144522 RepID=A0A1J4JTF6_9EUKA|nr:Suppressor Mra1 superfamily [Tritrichomonas foetus]|eukprot:OHT00780.1 Suppressor Mra1 superfamily [Tritrichomonas foetus]